jgi:hypothetical protein
MEEIEITGYLTQDKLLKVLITIFGEENLVGIEIPAIPNTRSRFDMAFKKGETIFIVEYDGDEHYRNSLKIKTDQEKDSWAVAQGFVVVRVPYWIQLTKETFEHYFGFATNYIITTNFNHGFIKTRILPASFCELGLNRWGNEMNMLPSEIKKEVLNSLIIKVNEFGIEYVLPENYRNIIA